MKYMIIINLIIIIIYVVHIFLINYNINPLFNLIHLENK